MLGGAHGSWKMEGREREIEGIEERETSDFLFFLSVVAQVADFVVHLSV